MLKAHSSMVLHTRKEIKTRINIAYESLAEQSFENLLTVLRVIFYLHPIPKFLEEINSIGSIPVTVFLENLLIKISMTKLKIAKTFKNWVITLLTQFTKTLPEVKTDNIKDLKIKTYELLSEWNQDIVMAFVNTDLESAVKRRDLGLISILIHFLRVFILHGEISKQNCFSTNAEEWTNLISNLIQGSMIADNLQKEEIAICICYYLCLKEKKFCHCALENGIISYLVTTLNRQFISHSFGKKIIQFIKYLLLNLDNRYIDQISIPLFEQALALFSSRFDKEQIIISIRDLVNILEQKVSVINYEQKLQHLNKLYQEFKDNIYASEKFLEGMHIINLYIQNERMENLIVKYYPNLLFKILHQQTNPQIVKMVSSFLSFNFKKGKFPLEVATQIIAKLRQTISNSSSRELLLDSRKKNLIDLVKIVKTILENREHHQNSVQNVKDQQLQSLLWQFSDFTNYIYEKQLIELHRMLMEDTQIKDKELEVLKQLQNQIINKSKFNINKVSWQLFEQVKFLQNLLNEEGKLQGYQISKEIPGVVSNYIKTTNYKVTYTLLENIENEESEHLRKEFNLICCKLLTKLLKNKKVSEYEPEVKAKMKALTTSKDEFDVIYDMINNFFCSEQKIQEEHEERQSILRASMKMQRQLEQQTQFTSHIRNLLYQYFRNNEIFDLNNVEISQANQFQSFIEELMHYENEEDILKFLKIVWELTLKDSLCGLVYKMLSMKIFQIYQALIERKQGQDEDIIMLIEMITLKFVKFHLKGLFNDQYDPDTVNLYLKYIGQIENHFQFGFSEKRIELLELIIEYLECNMIESHNEYEKMIKKENRSEFIRDFIDQNRPQAIGLSYSKLLSFNSDDEIHQDFWMLHKEHILRGLSQNTDNISYLKFLQIYISECQKFIYKEYQLQHLIQTVIELFIKECTTTDNIVNNPLAGYLSLRKIKYFSLTLFSFVERDDLKSNKTLLYSQEKALMKSISIMTQCSQVVVAESFKKFYIEQILVTLLKSLTKMYRLNFIDKEIRSEQLASYFDKLMQISNEDAINSVCQLMRIFLLKQFPSMADNPVLISCLEYLESLPEQGQQHIKACLRIQQLLAEDQSLDNEVKYYFAEKQEDENDQDFQNFAKTIVQDENREKPFVVWVPIDDPIPEEPNIIQKESQVKKPLQKRQEVKEQNIKMLEQRWTQFELLDYLKNILKSPQKYSIKKVLSKLQDLQNIEYCYLLIDLFLNSERCFDQDESDLKYNLEEVQEKIICFIPGQICPLDSQYFEVLRKNQIGSDICLRKKGGMKATEILSKKVIDSKDTRMFIRYLRNLSANIGSSNELKYLNSIKIEETINTRIQSLVDTPKHLKVVCDFITITAENNQLKNHYDVSEVLVKVLLEKELESDPKVSILKALAKLSKECNKHKQIAEKTKIVPYIAAILKNKANDPAIFTSASQCLSNIVDYSEALIPKIYHPLNLEELILGLLQLEVQKQVYSSFILSALKILQFLTVNDSSSKIVQKGVFPSLLNPICAIAIRSNNPQVIGLEVGIISNIIKNTDQLKKTIANLQAGQFLSFFVKGAHYIPKIRKTEMFLDIIIKIFTIPEMIMQSMGEEKEILKILVDVLKYTETEMVIIQKWTKILVVLFLQSKCIFFSAILKTNIFFLATSCLKQNNFLTQLTMDLSFRLMKELNMIEDPENLLIRHGFAGYMIQILRMKNIQTNNYITLLSMLKKLQEKSIFPPHLSTKLFEILLKKLHYHWNDELALQSILLLKKIKKNVEITTEFSNSLLEFFNKFLTQCSKTSGTYQYYAISREVICLVSYYINFNEDIKLIFKSQVMVNLLKSWLKTFKSVIEDQSHQTFRLWLYSVFNQQTLIHDVCSINNHKLQEIEQRFSKGWKANLFRMDGSYKQAILKYDKQKQEVFSFKFPDGEIKPKYRLPLNTILLMYLYTSAEDFLWKESRFTRTINPFQHSVNHKHCLTIFSLIQEKFEVREISIELQNLEQLQQIYVSLKIILNKMYERQREEEVKVWIARSSKEIPINNFG